MSHKTAIPPLHFCLLRKKDSCEVGKYFENRFSGSGGEIESYAEEEERAPVSTPEDRQDEEFVPFEEKLETAKLQETRSIAVENSTVGVIHRNASSSPLEFSSLPSKTRSTTVENPTVGVIHRNASSPSLGFSSLPSETRSTTLENSTVGVIRRNVSASSLEFSSLPSVRQSMLLSRKEEMVQQARR